MKRYLGLLGLFLFLGLVGTASAQVTYQITETPTFVIDTGRAEVLGSIRLTATNTGPTIGSTIQVLYQNVACDNDQTDGITVTGTGAFGGAGIVGAPKVQNTANGCIVSFTVLNAVVPAVGDHIDIQGARGRIDLVIGIADGQSIFASLNATPATSSLFLAPTTVAVATLEPGLIVNGVSVETVLVCLTKGVPSVQVKEGFNAAFVQHVKTAAGTATPTHFRPRAGANANTNIRIKVSNLDAGLGLTWPSFVCPDNTFTGADTGCGKGAAIAGGGANRASQLQLVAVSPDSSVALYEYACSDQTGICDVNTESFTVTPVVAGTPVVPFLTATVQATLAPAVLASGDPPADGSPFPGSGAIYPPNVPAPRFRPFYLPTPGATFIITGPCTTTLLFPWVTNQAKFDTGIAIANTSSDPFGTLLGLPTGTQQGTCTLYGWTANAGTAVTYTSPNILTGHTWATVLSSNANPAYNGFSGYIIARCNFQYAHAIAVITNNFGVSPPNMSQSYIALIIPDPAFQGGRFPSNTDLAVFGSGEGLSQ